MVVKLSNPLSGDTRHRNAAERLNNIRYGAVKRRPFVIRCLANIWADVAHSRSPNNQRDVTEAPVVPGSYFRIMCAVVGGTLLRALADNAGSTLVSSAAQSPTTQRQGWQIDGGCAAHNTGSRRAVAEGIEEIGR